MSGASTQIWGGVWLDKVAAYFAGLRSQTAHKEQSTYEIADAPVPVLLQSVPLTVTTSASARRAAAIMIGRLTPIPENQTVWDIAGPISSDEHRHVFTLGIVKRDALETWFQDNPEAQALNIKHDNQEFVFRTDDMINKGRRKTLYGLLAAALIYLASLWALGQWAERPARIAQVWQGNLKTIKTQTVSRSQSAMQAEQTIEQIKAYTSANEVHAIQTVLFALSKQISKEGRIIDITGGNGQVRIQGYTDDPLALARTLEALSICERVELGSTAQDRASGLQRFNLTMFLKAEVTP